MTALIRHKLLLFSVLMVFLVGCDRISKEVAREQLSGKPYRSFLMDTFRLGYVENTGAFLGLGAQIPDSIYYWLFCLIPTGLMALLAFYIVKMRNTLNLVACIALVMILSGGLGNVLDRILYHRHVADFMNIGIMNLRTGIINFADVYITSGLVLFLIFRKAKSGYHVTE